MAEPSRLPRCRPAWAMAALLAAASGPAAAHPHVRIDAAPTLHFDTAGRLAGVGMRWTFDEFYTAFALDGLDADGDGAYGPEELAPLAEENLAALAEWGYFTYLKLDGALAPLGPVRSHRSDHAGDRLSLAFLLPLEEPVDPRSVRISLASFDPTFYIDVVAQEPVRLDGSPPDGCAAVVEAPPPVEERSIADAQVEALDIGPEDDVEGTVGVRFASWITVSCPAGTAP